MTVRNYKELLKKITTMIFDYDGVFTDGKIILTEAGEQLRTANVKDGYALQLAVKKGYRIAVISGGTSDAIVTRLHNLKIK
jgi:3-deoxy-D-manno-octulosonate 8-phosphate phosphatase (KDO 8-P phosphatase)